MQPSMDVPESSRELDSESDLDPAPEQDPTEIRLVRRSQTPKCDVTGGCYS